MTFSEELRAQNQDLWDAMQVHRFVVDIENDRLPAAVFARYLVYEGAFVETAMAIFAYGLARAPDLERRIWFAGVIDALAREQIPYFEACFAELGINTADYRPLPDAVTVFRDEMLEIAASGTFSDVVIEMLAAEWMYATWCGRAAQARISDPALKRWVDLHAEPAFVTQAERLKDEANLIGAMADALEKGRLSAVFRRALELEVAFHSAAYWAT